MIHGYRAVLILAVALAPMPVFAQETLKQKMEASVKALETNFKKLFKNFSPANSEDPKDKLQQIIDFSETAEYKAKKAEYEAKTQTWGKLDYFAAKDEQFFDRTSNVVQ